MVQSQLFHRSIARSEIEKAFQDTLARFLSVKTAQSGATPISAPQRRVSLCVSQSIVQVQACISNLPLINDKLSFSKV